MCSPWGTKRAGAADAAERCRERAPNPHIRPRRLRSTRLRLPPWPQSRRSSFHHRPNVLVFKRLVQGHPRAFDDAIDFVRRAAERGRIANHAMGKGADEEAVVPRTVKNAA